MVSGGWGRGIRRTHPANDCGRRGRGESQFAVETLLLDDERVVGVRTADGEELRADAVISNIGARETVDHLLPADCGHRDWVAEIRSLPPSIAHFSLFLGFEGDVEDAGATRSNHWIYPTGEVDVLWTDAPDSPPPGTFISFASLKDPGHDPGASQKYAGEMVAWSDGRTWRNGRHGPGHPRRRLPSFKARVEETMLAQFEAYFPELAELVVFRNLSTPLTTTAITGQPPWRVLRPGRHARAGHERSAAGQDPCTGPLPFRSGRREPRYPRRPLGRCARRGKRGPQGVQAVAWVEGRR